MQNPLRLAIIIGSTREGRFGGVVAQWFAAQARQRDDIVVDLIEAWRSVPPRSRNRSGHSGSYGMTHTPSPAIMKDLGMSALTLTHPLRCADGGWGAMSAPWRAVTVLPGRACVSPRGTASWRGAWIRDRSGAPAAVGA